MEEEKKIRYRYLLNDSIKIKNMINDLETNITDLKADIFEVFNIDNTPACNNSLNNIENKTNDLKYELENNVIPTLKSRSY